MNIHYTLKEESTQDTQTKYVAWMVDHRNKIKSKDHAGQTVLARLPGEGLIGELLHPEKLLLHGWLGGRHSCKITATCRPKADFFYTPMFHDSHLRSRILHDFLAVFARRQWKSAGRAGRVLRVAARASVRHNVCTMISRPALRIDAPAADRFSCTIDKIRR